MNFAYVKTEHSVGERSRYSIHMISELGHDERISEKAVRNFPDWMVEAVNEINSKNLSNVRDVMHKKYTQKYTFTENYFWRY
jgi:hypothetical protein